MWVCGYVAGWMEVCGSRCITEWANVCGCVGVWVCGCVSVVVRVCECGCMVVWVYGCVGTWLGRCVVEGAWL